MRIDKVYIENFKNLRKFCIDLDENQMNTVFLGQNATGKSNLIEALVKIFKFLDLSNSNSRRFPEFKYWIRYQCYGKTITIEHLEDNNYIINVEGIPKSPSLKDFFSEDGKKKYLPQYIFTYYSGTSNRLDEIFWEHQRNFYKEIIKKGFDSSRLDSLRRLFYVKPIHSFFVLMAFFSLQRMEKKSKTFLKGVLGIEDLESVLFVIKEAKWDNEKGDPKFWGAEGLVKDFLSVVWNYSYAPIYHKETIYPDFRSKGIKENHLYLFLKDKVTLKKFAQEYFDVNKQKPNNTFLFKALESSYISDMLKEVKVVVTKKKDGKVTFKELSEGEQQLLTVIGLLIFTREDESLVLLDEPDTHLNPIWKYDYLHYLNSLVKSKNKLEENEDSNEIEEDKTTQIIINTHDPLVVGSMVKSQVRLFGKEIENQNDNSENPKDKYEELKQQALSFAIEPDIDPQGLGVAGILTSELFGLPSILDKTTQIKLNKKRYLQGKAMRRELTVSEDSEYKKLKSEMEKLGFYEESEDYWFKEYLKEMSKVESFQKVIFTEAEKLELSRKSQEIAKRIAQRKKDEKR